MSLTDFVVAYLKASFMLNAAGWATIVIIFALWLWLPHDD